MQLPCVIIIMGLLISRVAPFQPIRRFAFFERMRTISSNLCAASISLNTKEKCILVAVDKTTTSHQSLTFSLHESLSELSELCDTAGLEVVSTCVQRLPVPNPRSFFGEGKLQELAQMCALTGARVVIVDEDISPRQQRSLENALEKCGGGPRFAANIDNYDREDDSTDSIDTEKSADNLVESMDSEILDDYPENSSKKELSRYGEVRPPLSSPRATKRNKHAHEAKIAYTDSPSVAVKVLDRTAVILDIFAQHAKSKEGQLQVELAMLQYRSTRGPNVATSANGNSDNTVGDGKGSSGAGLRGPGETKIELDKRKMKTRIKILQDEIARLEQQRQTQRRGRVRTGAPLVALVGYTNAGKSTLLNKLSNAGVLAEDMLFATLDTTTRKIRLPNHRNKVDNIDEGSSHDIYLTPIDDAGEVQSQVVDSNAEHGYHHHGRQQGGMEIMLTDTVGFISKLPSHIVAAFRATLESVSDADILIHVCDRSNPAWQKQRAVVMQELDRIALRTGHRAPIVEFWNKVDRLSPADMQEALDDIENRPIEMELLTPPAQLSVQRQQHHMNMGTGSIQPTQIKPHPESDAAAIVDGSEVLEVIDDEILSVAYLPDDVNKADDLRNKIPTQVASAPAPPVDRNVAAGNTRKKRRQKQPFSVPEQQRQQGVDFNLHAQGSPSSHATVAAGDVSGTTSTELTVTGAVHAPSAQALEEEALHVHPSRVRIYTAAGSAVTGQGLGVLVARLEDALTAEYDILQCFVPFAQDVGVVSEIMTKGVVQELRYSEEGTSLRCKVPHYLAEKLAQFSVL